MAETVVEMRIIHDPQGSLDPKPYLAVIKFGDKTRGVCGSTPLEAFLLAANEWHHRSTPPYVKESR